MMPKLTVCPHRKLLDISAEFYAGLLSRYASPIEICVFAAVDERGEDVISDNLCCLCSGTQQRRKRGDRSAQLPDSVINKNKKQHMSVLA